MRMSTQKIITLSALTIGFGVLVYLLSMLGIIGGRLIISLIFLGSIGILYYSYMEEPNNFFKYYEHHKKITNWNKSVLFVYAKLIEIDGKVTDKELLLAKKILKKDMEENYRPEHFQFLKSSFGVEVEIKLPLRDVFENFGSAYCMLFLSNLIKLASTDGLMTKKEELFIRKIAKELIIGNRAFQTIMDRHSFITEEETQRNSRQTRVKNLNTKTAFSILGLDNTASLNEAKQAYRKLAKVYHPDKVKVKISKETAKQQFQAITDAYKTIKKEKG